MRLIAAKWTVLLLTAGVVWGQAREPVESRRADRRVAASRAPTGEESIAPLVRQLGSPDYEAREAADEQLRSIGMSAVDALAGAYRETDDFEIRIRIQRIVEQIFFWDRVLGRNAFMGIQHSVYRRSDRDDRVPAGQAAFEIRQVIPNTAAERSGLQAGDVILSVDGKTLPEGSDARDFADLIRLKLPGTPVVVELYRGEQHIVKEITLGYRGLRHYGTAAPQELNDQLEGAVQEFPGWWAARFGSALPRADEDGRNRKAPLFLELPSDYGRR
jgi:hypothetical protein